MEIKERLEKSNKLVEESKQEVKRLRGEIREEK